MNMIEYTIISINDINNNNSNNKYNNINNKNNKGLYCIDSSMMLFFMVLIKTIYKNNKINQLRKRKNALSYKF